MTAPNFEQIIADALGSVPALAGVKRRDSRAKIAAHVVAAIRDSGYTVIALPEADEWCREESCRHRHWKSGSMPTHKRGADCPPAQHAGDTQ